MSSSIISLWSLDFDGCLLNEAVHDAFSKHAPQDLIEAAKVFIQHNSRLFKEIKESTDNNPNPTIILNGSNRQSNAIDLINRNKNFGLSVFEILPFIANYIENAALDAALLSDIFCDLEPGTSWKTFHDKQAAQPGCPLDGSKILLIYSQMQHAAKLYQQDPRTQLELNFVDDRMDILVGLTDFFEKNTDMIPQGLKLNLHHYDGTDLTLSASIKGSGNKDPHYRSTIKAMTHANKRPIDSGWHLGAEPYPGIYKIDMSKIEKYRARVIPAEKPQTVPTSIIIESPTFAPDDDELTLSSAETTPRLLTRTGHHFMRRASTNSTLFSPTTSSREPSSLLLSNNSNNEATPEEQFASPLITTP